MDGDASSRPASSVEGAVAANRALWDEWTPINARAPFYRMEDFKRGALKLKPYEIEDVGNVQGKSLLHLQCHFGMDSLSWARLGATVTGVDFSPRAIERARALSEEVGVEARFIESDLYALPGVLDEQFDVVYTSRGVLGWLPDIERWGQVAAHFVKPGGILYVTEVHPLVWVLDEEHRLPDLRLKYHYWSRPEPLAFPVQGSYADPQAKVDAPFEYGWNHSLGEYVTAIARAGLRIEFLREEDFVEWPVWFLDPAEDGTWRLPEDAGGEIPLFFTLKATKPA
jgi:SAM-dependent methyltransferase